MATEINLDDIVAAAEKKYGDYVIHGKDVDGPFYVTMRPLLRLSEDEREAVTKLFEDDDTEPEDEGVVSVKKRKSPDSALADFIRLVSTNVTYADRLLAKIGPARLDVLKTIQENWVEKTQAGEAKPSQS